MHVYYNAEYCILSRMRSVCTGAYSRLNFCYLWEFSSIFFLLSEHFGVLPDLGIFMPMPMHRHKAYPSLPDMQKFVERTLATKFAMSNNCRLDFSEFVPVQAFPSFPDISVPCVCVCVFVCLCVCVCDLYVCV